MRHLTCVAILLLLGTLGGCCTKASKGSGDHTLVWRDDAVGPECSLVAVPDAPGTQQPALQIITHSLPDDPQNEKPIARAIIARRDGMQLCTLGELTQPGAVLRFKTYRDPATSKDVPGFTLPYVFLLIAHPDGTTSRLLWESPYNGYSPYSQKPPPTGAWITLDLINGIYWPQTDALNFNMNDGFQTLTKYASGFQATRKVDGKQSQPYAADSRVIALGVGSGSGIGGHFVAYVTDIELATPAGTRYLMTFPANSKLLAK